MNKRSITGCLLGTAAGDALGLPCEGIPRRRQRQLFPDVRAYHFLFGRGMVSDDTEHTIMVAQALIASGGEVTVFRRHLARQFRLWLLGVPAGVGLATLKAIVKLWLGFGEERSGVFSAGNGPAMRSALLGVFCPDDRAKLGALVRASTRLTHTDPKAEWGAYAVALAAAMASAKAPVAPQAYLARLESDLGADAVELLGLARQAVQSACAGQSSEEFAAELGLGQGVSGYVYHTVPVVLQTWLRHQEDFENGLIEIIRCGGDTDTTASILGGLIGARVGKAGIPARLLSSLREWPQSVGWMEGLGRRLAAVTESGQPGRMLAAHGGFLRNLLCLVVVLAHGFRRLLPPY